MKRLNFSTLGSERFFSDVCENAQEFFLKNKMVDVGENLIMNSLQSDSDNCSNKGAEYSENVQNVMPMFLSLIRELKEDLRDLKKRISTLEEGTEKPGNNVIKEHINKKDVERIGKGFQKIDQRKSVKNNGNFWFKEREEWHRRRGHALEKIREIYMQLARLNSELDSLC